MSFHCDACGAHNNEVQSAGKIRGMTLLSKYRTFLIVYSDKGIHYKVTLNKQGDLDRQVVKSETCTVKFPELELEIPASRGQLTTVEGLLRDTIADLEFMQPLRRTQTPDAYEKIQRVLEAVGEIVPENADSKAPASEPLSKTVTIELDDPTGNSYIEFIGSMADTQWHMQEYTRTAAQNAELGFASNVEAEPRHEEASKGNDVDDPEEIFVFPGPCPSCSTPIDTLMKKVNIPYFKVGPI